MKLDAHNPRVFVNETIRAHMDACGSKIGAVVFYKKDGSLRHMRFQLAAGPSRIKGTERGQRASATRQANHPFLKPVWEIGNDWRMVNLDTVVSVRASGKVTRYRDVTPLGNGRYALSPIIRIRAGIEESTS